MNIIKNKNRSRLSAVLFSLVICFMLSFPASALEADELVPIGKAVGIDIKTDGVVIVGLSELEGKDGKVSPAASAGLKVGDIIIKVDSFEIKTSADFITAAANFDGSDVTVTVSRQGEQIQYTITPAQTAEGTYQLGLWMRDGISGIGTVTFYDPKSGAYGALGHGITDTDTGSLLPTGEGSISKAIVIDVKKGEVSNPGELRGSYEKDDILGNIEINCESGIYGITEGEFSGNLLPVAQESEIELGKATIYSNVTGEDVQEFEIEITRIFRDTEDCKTMMIKVTDESLIAVTGGIVQGMSGSPIIQNGKIIGAVTHVLISDPTRGYGISIDKMLLSCEVPQENAA